MLLSANGPSLSISSRGVWWDYIPISYAETLFSNASSNGEITTFFKRVIGVPDLITSSSETNCRAPQSNPTTSIITTLPHVVDDPNAITQYYSTAAPTTVPMSEQEQSQPIGRARAGREMFWGLKRILKMGTLYIYLRNFLICGHKKRVNIHFFFFFFIGLEPFILILKWLFLILFLTYDSIRFRLTVGPFMNVEINL